MDELEPQAIQTDIYLDWLLGGGPHDPAIEPDADIRRTADVVQRSLARFHPSFRFEERLADRLRAESSAGHQVEPARVIPFARPGAASSTSSPQSTAHAEGHGRGLILGGAIASTVSIAGAVLVWRRVRTGAAAPAVEQAV